MFHLPTYPLKVVIHPPKEVVHKNTHTHTPTPPLTRSQTPAVHGRPLQVLAEEEAGDSSFQVALSLGHTVRVKPHWQQEL